MPPRRRLLSAGALAPFVAACSPLAVFDAVAGRDPGAAKAASALPYGPHPRQTVDVWVPAARGSAAPVAVFFYGGSWSSGAKEDYAFVGAALAAQGFVTFVPDYRLFPEVRFPDFLFDSAAAVRFARDEAGRFGGDGRRLVLAGHSAGAYNAAMLALDGRYLARAGLRPGAVRAFAGLSGPYDFLPLEAGPGQDTFGAAPDKAATQPVTFVSRGDPPAFLATGDADRTVRPANTISLARKLRAVGTPVVERVYPGLDHRDTLLSLSVLARGTAPVLAEMSAFLHRFAGENRPATAGERPLSPADR